MHDHSHVPVWARADRVDVVVDGARRPMRRIPHQPDWWVLDQPLQPGNRYAFSLDGGDPLPDPRSISQPEGVHGPSRLVDRALFQRAPGWAGRDVRGAVLYELHIGTFTAAGTFDAAIDKLDALVELGIEGVEVMPVPDFPGARGWGYDGAGLYSVHEAYGGPEGFVRFIDAAHERGLAVLLDVVHNHLGPEGNYLSHFGPYFTNHHHTPWGDAVNLDDDGSHEVRRFLIDSARQWLVDFQLDGLRLDAVHALADDSETHFLVELAEDVAAWQEEIGRPLSLIAESDLNQPSMVSPVGSTEQARGMDAQWDDDVHHALHSFLTGETQGYYVDFGSVGVLAQALTQVFVHAGGYSTFRGERWGAPVDPDSRLYDGHSFVVYLQNHDQVGNRAAGDRISADRDPGLQAAGAALYLLSAFTPMLFMGEEWAASTPFPYFSALGPELGPKVTEGRAREFRHMGWDTPTPDPQSTSTFRSAKLRWNERAAPDHARMLDWYRSLIRLRRDRPGLLDPGLRSTSVEIVDDDTLVMRRGDVTVAVTRAAGREVEVDLGGVEVLASWDEPRPLGAGRFALSQPGALVVRRND